MIAGTPYRLIRWLGEGGMGVVYLAEHTVIERKVAIKSLHPHLGRKQKVAHVFREEARASARIGHPNIIEVLDFQELGDGRLLYVMEYLEGTTLLNYVEEERMPVERLLPILRLTAKGLHAAHSTGIVHRDVKPENIMLVDKDGREDFPKIVDFGIAALMSDEDAQNKRAGTPHYISPEQIRKDGFDGRVDMYALACTAYEVLTGRPPFEGDSVREVLRAHLYEEPVPPTELVGEEVCPKPFEDVLMMALSKNKDDRYQHMADFEAALCEAQIFMQMRTAWDDLPLPSDIHPELHAWLEERMPKFVEENPRRKWVFGGVAAAALMVGGGLTYAFAGGQYEPGPIDALTIAAHQAASKAFYVYPPTEDPAAATAFQKVRQLESMEDEHDDPGDERGEELRDEFSATLVRLGDRYVDKPGGRPFALDFYQQALIFDPDNTRANEVMPMLPGMLAEATRKAAEADYSPAELAQAEIITAMAEEDDSEREKKLASAVEKSVKTQSFTRSAALVSLLREEGMQVPEILDAPAPTGRTSAEIGVANQDAIAAGLSESDAQIFDLVPLIRLAWADGEITDAERGQILELLDMRGIPSTSLAYARVVTLLESAPDAEWFESTGDAIRKLLGGDDAPNDATAPVPDVESPAAVDPDDGSTSRRDKNAAAKLAKSGTAAMKAGNQRRAESLFHKALTKNRHNKAALSGLGTLYFNQGRYSKAVTFFKRAVQISKRDSGLRIKLGDAYFKVLRYADALRQYQEAARMGNKNAAARVDKVRSRM
jgi:tRNA A-37 threonylcarbamoyl transferase component Bud32